MRPISRTKLDRRVWTLAKNTAEAADFTIETLRAESRYFARRAIAKIKCRLNRSETTEKTDVSLEPLAGFESRSP